MMNSRLLAAVSVLMISVVFPASAEESTRPKGVVELFTSQGCRSCPPADKALETLVKQGEVVALSYHVDYWNYLGWNDTLATPENTKRQYAYAKSLGRSGVYTPQAVINGRDHVAGGNMTAIVDKVEGLKDVGKGLTVPVSATKRGDEIDIEIGPGAGKAEVVMVYFRRQQSVEVLKGENKGQNLTYWNSVTDVQTVGMWHGDTMELTLPAKVMAEGNSDGCAVLLQASNHKGQPTEIIGATVLSAAK